MYLVRKITLKIHEIICKYFGVAFHRKIHESTVYQVEENGWINEYMLAVQILDFLFLYTHLF